jgi:hypothetical protein
MQPQRLGPERIAQLLKTCPDELCDLVLAVRDLVLRVVPGCVEARKFGCLSYFKPDHPYGSIGGNICMIGWRDDAVHLAFIHGAALPDPEQLLCGSGRAKRHVPLTSTSQVCRPALVRLIRAAVAYSPLEGG